MPACAQYNPAVMADDTIPTKWFLSKHYTKLITTLAVSDISGPLVTSVLALSVWSWTPKEA